MQINDDYDEPKYLTKTVQIKYHGMSHVQIDFIKEYFPDCGLPITFVFYQNIDTECSIRTLQRNKPSLVHIKAIFPKRTNLLHKLDVGKDKVVLSSFVLGFFRNLQQRLWHFKSCFI